MFLFLCYLIKNDEIITTTFFLKFVFFNFFKQMHLIIYNFIIIIIIYFLFMLVVLQHLDQLVQRLVQAIDGVAPAVEGIVEHLPAARGARYRARNAPHAQPQRADDLHGVRPRVLWRRARQLVLDRKPAAAGSLRSCAAAGDQPGRGGRP